MWPGSALVVDEATAHAFVEGCADRGYAAIKAYSFLSESALNALGRASAAAGMPLVGYCPRTAGVPGFFMAWTMVRHCRRFECCRT